MKTLYKCELVAEKGIVKERFYREGHSADEVEKELMELFWPKGEWHITKNGQEENDHGCFWSSDEI